MISTRTGLLAAVFFAIAVTVPADEASAATTDQAAITESILITPVSKRYELKAGTTKTDTVKVFNDGREDYNFIVYARPYSVDNEEYEPNFISESRNTNAYKWVQFEKASYFIKAGETVDVGYTIRVPEGAAPGGHYGVLFAETQPSENANGNAVKRKKRVGAIMYLTVDGKINRKGSLESIDTSFFQFTSPLRSSQRVSNSGNTDFQANTRTRVLDVFGRVKHDTQKEYTVLPETTRKMVSEWPGASWIGLYKVETNVKFLDTDRTSSSYVLLVPVWVYATLTVLITGRILYAVANRNKK